MLTLYIFLPLLCVAATPPTLRASERLVFGIASYELLIVGLGVTLGTARQLTPVIYGAGSMLAALLLAFVIVRRRKLPHGGVRSARLMRWLTTRRGLFAALVATVVVAMFVLQVALDVVVGSLHWDGIWYHLPRVLAWRQQSHFDTWEGAGWPELGHPVAADLALGTKILLGLSVHGVAYVSLILTIGAIAAVYAIGRDLKLSRWSSVMAAMLFASFPVVGNRVAASSSDIAAALPVLAGYLALVRLRRLEHAWAAFVLLAATGVACKLSIVPFVVLLALGASYRRSCVVSLAWACKPLPLSTMAAGFLLVMASYLPVYEAFGDFTGGETGREHRVQSASDVGIALGASSLHWIFEPFGYVPHHARPTAVTDAINAAYEGAGVERDQVPRWHPNPTPDTASTGALLGLLVPVAFLALPRGRARGVAAVLWGVGYVALFGPIRAQPFAGRFAVVLFAGLAIVWAAGRLGRSRAFMAIMALNVALMLPLWWWSTAQALVWRTNGGYLHALAADRAITDLQPPSERLLRAIILLEM